MTWFEFAVTYAVCWWMVLFMVLPHQAQAAANPEPGHARSAPANPQIKKKIRWATLWAILPAVALYFIVNEAKAAETIYHAGGGCKPVNATPSADLSTKDGYGTNGRQVAPATISDPNANIVGDQDHFNIPLLIPSAKYANRAASNGSGNNSITPNGSGSNVDLSQSFVDMGNIDVGRDGTTSINGHQINNSTTADGCSQDIQ